jgi:hypothetical protein
MRRPRTRPVGVRALFVIDQIALSELAKALREELGRRCAVIIQHTVALGAISAALGFRNLESVAALVGQRPIILGELMRGSSLEVTPRQIGRQLGRLIAYEIRQGHKPADNPSAPSPTGLRYDRLAALIVAAGKASRLTTYLALRVPGESDVRRLDIDPRFEVRDNCIVCTLVKDNFTPYDCKPDMPSMAHRMAEHLQRRGIAKLADEIALEAWEAAFGRAVLKGSDREGWEEQAALSMLHPVWQRDVPESEILDEDEFMEVVGRLTLEGVGAALLKRAFTTRAAAFFPGETPLGFGTWNGFSKVNDTLPADLEPVERIQRELESAY